MLSFKQFEFQPNEDFEPSKETKDSWLYTKKSRSTFAGIELPGLFETTGYTTAFAAFIGILILETIPTILGYSEGVFYPAIVASVIVDIILAVVSHRWHEKICRYKNELIIADSPIEKESLKRKISSCRKYTNMFYFVILISGCLKVFLYYQAHYYGMPKITIDALIIGVTVCYLTAATLHITYTGYFFYTSRFNYSIKREHDEYIESKGITHGITDFLEQPINTENTNVEIKEVRAGKHSIFQKENKYYFKTYGILTDTELASLIGVQQSAISQGLIARQGLKHQMLILNTSLTTQKL